MSCKQKFQITFTKEFLRKERALTKKSPSLKNKISEVIRLLAKNPTNPKLRTHKVNSRKYGKQLSSRINSDLRIIWNYDKEKNSIIILMTIGSYSGKNNVYK